MAGTRLPLKPGLTVSAPTVGNPTGWGGPPGQLQMAPGQMPMDPRVQRQQMLEQWARGRMQRPQF